MEFWRYYRIIRRRRWLIIIGMAICVSAVAFNNFTTEPLYTGRTTVMESEGMSKQQIPLFPEQFMQMDTQLRLSNLGNIATSQRVMQNSATTLRDFDLTLSPEEILKNTSISPVRDTNIIAVEVTLPNDNDAKIAADVVATEFKKVYGELNNSSVRQSREFIEAQLETARKALIKAHGNLRRFKEESGVVSYEAQAGSTIQRISQAKVELNQSVAATNGAEAAIKRLETEMSKLPETYVSGTQISRDPLWQNLMSQLAGLETQKAQMVVGTPGQPRRGENHPAVGAVTAQIADVTGQLQGMKENFVAAETTSKNPNMTGAIDRWIVAKVEYVSNNARMAAAQQAVAAATAELNELPASEAKLAELEAERRSTAETYSLMRSKLDEARIKEQQSKNEVALVTVDPASWFPVDQRRTLKLIIALLLSPLLGIGAAFMLHYTDNTIKTAVEAEKLLGLPICSAVPEARAHSLVRQRCSEIVNVAYQMLTSSLWIASHNQDLRALVMVSAEPDVGRSVTASNLAVSLSREGARVVLVDADFRQPTQHMIFSVDNKIGLSNLLSGAASLEDVLIPTRVQGLLLVPTGPVPENPVKFLRSQEMRDFAEQIQEAADFVIYDTPAGVTFPDAVLVASQVGSAIVVHSAGRVPRGSEAEFKSRLESVGVKLIGAVLNKVKREDSSGFFHYRRSYEGIAVGVLPGGKKALRNGRGGDI